MTSDVTFNELDALDAELLPERTVLSSITLADSGDGGLLQPVTKVVGGLGL